MYIDAHLHLLNEQELINAHQMKVNTFVINATKEDEWDKIIELSKKYDFCHAAIGIHPWFINTASNNWETKMDCLLEKYPFLMIGEIGLDCLKEDLKTQTAIFETTLKLAQKHKRIVHIHCVKAWDILFKVIEKTPELTFLFHRFSASKEIIDHLKKYNAWFSISRPQIAMNLPKNKILTETDNDQKIYSFSKLKNLVDNLPITADEIEDNFKNLISNTTLARD
jgi:TatD DNase family protein